MNQSDPYHQPVLVDEAVAFLVTAADGAYIDATCGGGGHSLAITSRLSAGGRLLAIDRDIEAVTATRERLRNVTPQVQVVQGRFSDMQTSATKAAFGPIRGILMDLGLSSYQIDNPVRGVSYAAAGPLDLRMDQHAPLTAADIVREYSQEQLARILFEFGGEKNSRRIAAAIVSARASRDLTTTADLAKVIARTTNPRFLNKTLSRCFQALRIVVNDEINELNQGLEAAAALLTSGGRLVVIAYHSLEDGTVKRFMRARAASPDATPPRLRLLIKKPLAPSPEEIAANPRARSAKLRAAEII